MKCKLFGIQKLDFTSQDTGEQIQGNKLHVVSEVSENDPSGMRGQRCAAVFTKLDVSGLKIGGNIDLAYEQILGSNKTRLVAITNC